MHFGILGMHWGKRKVGSKPSNKPRGWFREAGTTVGNVIKHPILTANANVSSQAAGSTKNAVRRSMVWNTTSDLRDVNARVKALLATKKIDKKQVNNSSVHAGKALVAGMLLGNLANVAVTVATKKPLVGTIASGFVTAVGTKEVYNRINK